MSVLNAEQKREFINDLIESVKETILGNVPNMPEDWDGNELRRYIADKFSTYTNMGSARLRAYRKTILISDL